MNIQYWSPLGYSKTYFILWSTPYLCALSVFLLVRLVVLASVPYANFPCVFLVTWSNLISPLIRHSPYFLKAQFIASDTASSSQSAPSLHHDSVGWVVWYSNVNLVFNARKLCSIAYQLCYQLPSHAKWEWSQIFWGLTRIKNIESLVLCGSH